MRTKITLLLLAWMLAGSAFAQTQLKHWYMSGYDISFQSTTNPPTTTYNSNSNFANIGYTPRNGIYDANNNIRFYINNFHVYDANNNDIGSLTSSTNLQYTSEISIVPFISNTDCIRNYHIFFSDVVSGVASLHHKIVSHNSSSNTLTISNGSAGEIISTLSGYVSAGIAVSTVKKDINNNNVRYLYFVSAYSGTTAAVRKISIDPNASNEIGLSQDIFTASNMGGYVFEADLSPDGSRLAWGSSEKVYTISLDNFGGYVNNSLLFFNVPRVEDTNSPIGIEFDKSNNILYFSTGSMDEPGVDGIYYINVATGGTPTLIANTLTFGASQLEMGYNGLIYACSNIIGIEGIDPTTNSLVPASIISNVAPQILYSGSDYPYLFPDQIDGENYTNTLSLSYFDVSNFTFPNTIYSTWTPSNSSLIISGTSSTVKIENELRFSAHNGGSTNITITGMNFLFGKNAQLIIENYMTVNFIDCKFSAWNCPNTAMWQGIVVQLGGNINMSSSIAHTIGYKATFKSSISDAIAGVSVSAASFNFSETLFDKNIRGLVLTDCIGLDGLHNDVNNCEFWNDVQLKDQIDQLGGVLNPNNNKYYGKTCIDISNSSNTTLNNEIFFQNNGFYYGKYGVYDIGASIYLYYNYFNFIDAIDVMVDMNGSANVVDMINNWIGSGIAFVGKNSIGGAFTLGLNIISILGVLPNDVVQIFSNTNCNIKVNANSITNFEQKAVNLYSNIGSLTSIEVGGNTLGGNTSLASSLSSTSCGISITESEADTSMRSYKSLNVHNNFIDGVALGIVTQYVIENQNRTGQWVAGSSTPSDINSNSINFYATNYTGTTGPVPLTDYNTGIRLNNSVGLNVVNNPINQDPNTVFPYNGNWRNMGIESHLTSYSLFLSNTIKAGRGISGEYSSFGNNYYCNQFNYNVCGFSFQDHYMRSSPQTHGIVNVINRDNTFIGTFNTGSDIEFIVGNGTAYYANTGSLQPSFNANQWVFYSPLLSGFYHVILPLVKYFPDPNPVYHLGAPFKHINYIYAGAAPNAYSCYVPKYEYWDIDPVHQIATTNGNLPNDLFNNWLFLYNNEVQLKKQNQVSNVFISKLIDLDNAIYAKQYALALTILTTMHPQDVYSTNYMIVYQPILNALTPIMRALTDSETLILSGIASQNLPVGGPAVDVARAKLWSEKGLRFRDADPVRLVGINAKIVYSPCYTHLPDDIQANLVDETNTVYTNIPVIINDDGRIYVSDEYASTLSTNHIYGFKLNYSNTNPGLMPLSSLEQLQSNNYILCNIFGKTGSEKKSSKSKLNPLTDSKPISIYPNPASSSINIDLPNDQMEYSVEVYNIVGKKVYDGKFNVSFTINTTNFDNGIYFIKIIDSNGELVKNEKISIIK